MKAYRGLFTFFSGNVVVQMIALLVMPIVTRLYNPAELGIYQFITTIALIFSPFVAFSLNHALVKEVNEERRNQLFYGSLTIISISSIVLTLLFGVVYKNIDLNFEISYVHFILLFLTFLLSAFFAITQGLNLSENEYGRYTKSTIIQSLSGNASKVILGFYSSTASSLLLAIALGSFLAAIYNIKTFFKAKLLCSSIKSAFKELVLNKKFTLYFTLSEFIGIFLNWHIVLLAPLFGSLTEIGLLALALMITRTPMYPFLMSISNYCYAELVKKMSNNESVKKLVFIISIIGAFISLGSSFILFVFGEDLIGFVFGSSWGDATQYAFWLSISMITAFVLYPIYYSISNIKGYQDKLLYMDMVMIFVSAFIVFCCLCSNLGLLEFVVYSSISMFVSHILKFLLIIYLDSASFREKGILS